MRYAELHCKTNFSFLEGASHPDELVATAHAHGYAALAVTDRNSLAGVVRAHVEAKECGLKIIIGAEIHPSDAPPVVLWATDRKSYGRLCRLITVGRMRAEKGSCELWFEDIARHAEELVAGVVPDFSLTPNPSPAKPGEGNRFDYQSLPIWESGDIGFIPPLTPPFEGGESETLPFLLALKMKQMNSSPLSRLCGRGAGGEGRLCGNETSSEDAFGFATTPAFQREELIKFPSLLGRGQGRVIQDHFHYLIN